MGVPSMVAPLGMGSLGQSYGRVGGLVLYSGSGGGGAAGLVSK